MYLFLKILGGMANSEDPDQTAPWCLHCLHLSVYKKLSAQKV